MTTYPAGHMFGKYVVTQRLGRGGMAEVYLAHDPLLDRRVAIKVILPHLTADEAFVTRFRREAKLIASLRHANIVQVFDFDVVDEQPYMVMEYLAGETLKAELASRRARGERMALAESVRLLSALAAALDYAHAQGAIHRDIKPANILFTAQNEPVLTDFGIAKLLDQPMPMTMTGNIVGTPAYMSPEQAAGKPVDGRGDLYALGVVAYELATGRVPFQGDSPTAVLMQHLLEPPPAPRTFNRNLPATVEQVLLQALAKEPGARFASAGAFATALSHALAGKVAAAASPEEMTFVEPTAAAVRAPGLESTPPPRQQRASTVVQAQPAETAAIHTDFVARKQELTQLQAFLERALAGQGQLCFVTGEAGAGKTALVTEFARRAQRAHAELVVAAGNCNTQSGVGDPYLPFRELLTRLVGLAVTGWTAEVIGPEQGSQPAGVRGLPGQALAAHGPDLIDIFVPGDAFLAQLGDQAETHSTWMEQLARLAQRKAQAVDAESGIEQRHIFEQYTNVLTALAMQQPLLLVVDDLQWVDSASADLLFHLSRRTGESRILLVGTYRPDEVALGRSGAAHPLEKVLAELKRYRGDIQVSLGQENEPARRNFIDLLLDREPNHLNRDFRQALFHHTGGHALFTVELLRNMQERGDLIQNEKGRWVVASQLDWKKLPPRVEGVIEERIGRLEDELREVLTIASVEGEDFTAEVVARVQQIDERGLIRQLSHELDRHHRLVSAHGRQRVGRQHLSSYRFRHNLFQKYLYNLLDAVERAYFHEDVGLVLEELYGDTADAIAVQLAWHFSEADLQEKARPYLAIAGEQARRRYANAEALSYLDRALDLTPETDDAERYTLLLARQKVYDVLGDRQAQRQDLDELEALAERLNDRRRQAEVALGQTLYADRIGEYRTEMTYAQRAIELAAAGHDAEQEATGYQRWGRALLNLSDYGEAQFKLERAYALADAEQLPQVKADSLRSLGVVAYFLGDFAGAAATYEQALSLYQAVGDRRGEGHSLSNLGLAYREQGKYAEARSYFDQAYQLSQQTGARAAEALALLGIGDVFKDQEEYTSAAAQYEQAFLTFRAIGDRREEHLALKELANTVLSQGDHVTARAHYEVALACFREIGDRQSESSTLNRLGLLYHQIGDEEAARANSQAALTIAQEIGDRWLENSSLTKLGHALAGLAQADAAAECYEKAVNLWRELGRPDLALESVAGLAQIALDSGKLARAQAYAEEIIVQLDYDAFSNHGMAEEQLICYRVLQANQDARAAEILRTAYNQVQTSAARIDDQAMQRSYLENVPAHRAIVSEWEALQRSTPVDPSEDATVAE